ncbi:MAG: hypothetical protein JJLCMIEE_00063 [Acidimicrobiales bacterium]|nr:hypothetical protein [Acidimicrobiales bacterium]
MRTMSKVALALVLVFGLLGIPAVDADGGVPGNGPDPGLITWEGELEASPTSGYSPLDVTFDASGASHPDPQRHIVGYWWAFVGLVPTDDIDWQYSTEPVNSTTFTEPGLWAAAAVAVDDLGGQGLLLSPVVSVPFRDFGELGVSIDEGSPYTVTFDASGASHPDPQRHFVDYWWTFDPELMIPDDYGTEQAEDPFWAFDLSQPGWQHTTEPSIEHTFEPGLARAQVVLVDDEGGYGLMEGETQVLGGEMFEVKFGPLVLFSSLTSTRPYWAEVTNDSSGPKTIVALAAPDYQLSANLTISALGLAAQRIGAGPSYAGFFRFVANGGATFWDLPFVAQVAVGDDGVISGAFFHRIGGWDSFDIPVGWRVRDGD